MAQTSNALGTGRPELTRRHDVDWLRALGMITVFLFHCARSFDTDGWHIRSPRTSPGLLTGIVTFVLGYFLYKAAEPWAWLPREFTMSFLRGVLCWSWLVAICGVTSRHLRFRNGFLKYANEAVLPFYVLHQTVILTIGYYVLRLDTSLWGEYLIIAASSFLVIMALYERLLRRINILRFLFGLKPLRRPQPVPAPQLSPST